MKNLKLTIVALITASVLSACVIPPPSYKTLDKDIDKQDLKLNGDYDKYQLANSKRAQTAPLVLDNAYTGNPAWLKSKITLHARNMPFSKVTNRLLQGTSALNVLGQGVSDNTPVSIDFSGTRENAIKLLSSKTGYGYTIEGQTLTWSIFITRTFDVSFMPGASKYLVGGNAGGGGGTGGTTTTGNIPTYGQFSSTEGDISLWKDLETTIKTMLSDKGTVNVSQATTTITVTDRPENVAKIQNYLANMNQSLSRQVQLDVTVLEVQLDNHFVYGIDWNLVREFTSQRYLGTLASSQSGILNNPSLIVPGTTNGLIFNSNKGPWMNSQVIINALATQGKVSVATQPRVVTLNNQVAQIGINTSTGYLAQVATTIVAQTGTTTTLTPGTVVTGFSLYLLPKVQGDNVYLQISSIISNLEQLKQYNGTPTTSTTISSSNGNSATANSSNGQVIYAPILTEKRFNQRSLVPSGATLVLAGFKQLSNGNSKNSIAGLDALGGYGGDKSNKETIILITPTIVNPQG